MPKQVSENVFIPELVLKLSAKLKRISLKYNEYVFQNEELIDERKLQPYLTL